MIDQSYGTFSSSRADDQAFLALRDAAQVTADLPDTRVVGGMMVSLLTEAFPAQGFVVRRTADVDAALSVHIAQMRCTTLPPAKFGSACSRRTHRSSVLSIRVSVILSCCADALVLGPLA